MNPRLHIPLPFTDGAALPLTEGQQHHLAVVLRLKDGAPVRVFNGQEGEWDARFSLQGKKAFAVVHRQRMEQAPVADVGLLFAPVKKGPVDFLAQKATELGAAWLQPVRTRRTIAARVNEMRLLANAVEAAEQTGRMDIPRILPFASLETAVLALRPSTRLLFCDESRQAPPLKQALLARQADWGLPWAVVVGPEGGFTPEEAAFLKDMPHCVPCHLGPRLLRADTAALAALAGWQMMTQADAL